MACDYFDLAVLGDGTSLEACGGVSRVESCVLEDTCMVCIGREGSTGLLQFRQQVTKLGQGRWLCFKKKRSQRLVMDE